jgi:hypothetical protein
MFKFVNRARAVPGPQTCINKTATSYRLIYLSFLREFMRSNNISFEVALRALPDVLNNPYEQPIGVDHART